MATTIEKVAMALVIISLVLGAASLAYVMSLTSMFTDVSNRLSRLENAITVGELFPGETDLYLKAKEEGAIVYYSFEGSASATPMINAFQKRYPGISCTNVGFSTAADFIGRVTTEHNAGQGTSDVIASVDVINYAKPKGWIVPYESAQLSKLIMQNNATPVYSLVFNVLIYNKNKLNTSDVPTSWENLTDPKYMGKIAMGDPTLPGRPPETLAMLKTYWNDDAKWTNFVQGLKANNPTIFSGSGLVTQAVVAGEYSLGFLSMTIDTARAIQQGSPIDYARIKPAPTYVSLIGVDSLAPHPNAARLFIEFRLSVDGQAVTQSLAQMPNRADVPAPSPGVIGGGTTYWIPGITASQILYPPQAYVTDAQGWINQNIKPLWT